MAREKNYTIEIGTKPAVYDVLGEDVLRAIRDFGIGTVTRVRFVQVYRITGGLSDEKARTICRDVLCDPIVQTGSVRAGGGRRYPGQRTIAVWYKAGVTDTVAESTRRAIEDIGITGVSHIATGRQFLLTGSVTARQLETIATKVLSNPLIEEYTLG